MIISYLQDNDSDIWDDTALIKAYDEAVNLMKVGLFIKHLLRSHLH